ncbi:hypothetical protein BU25DRAFT_493829 [Macroventuria anomochaeta]|uniref:Uncharacterized protein n=1 Tax=Macroventuria anomochaeta TaxID=301207 RepID=A0ACB6RSW8_9PLEO|nr:uncharacterized protein BU25DRAFT_493829 [Macroventuria anomochaeta]KAF2624233.1 hypothetical protein BU25DRAFT_493829 [Macroventuria anomochaeta]
MSEWRQKGFVQDSDEEEDELQIESQHSKQDTRPRGRVERVLKAQDGQNPNEDAVAQDQKDAESSAVASDEPLVAFGGDFISQTPTRHTSPKRPTPSPFTPSTRPTFQDDRSGSPGSLESSADLKPRSQKPDFSSRSLRSPTLQRISQEEIQLQAPAAIPSQILGETTKPVHEFSRSGELKNVKASTILGEFGVEAPSDDSEDELNLGQGSDGESNLSDYPSDLSDGEPRPATVYATPCRRTAVQVVIPSSTALQQQLAQEEARRRHFRQRKPIQLHPYVLEGERYRREVQSRGLKPVPRERSPQRRQGQNNVETQEEEFDPFRDYSSSPPDPEIFVSTPVTQPTRKDAQPHSSTKRPRLDPSRRKSPVTQLRVPKPVKRRRLNVSLTQALATPAETSESSPLPLDIWSVPPNSPPCSSSPPHKAQLRNVLSTSNADSLPTPSNSSTFHDDPQLLPDSDSDPVPRGAQRSGGELRRPTRIVLSDEPSSDSDAAGSESEQVVGELQRVSKKIRGVLPASWLRIDRQAQERRQALARQRARLNITLSPEPSEPQRGVAQRVSRLLGRPADPARPTAAPAGVVVISDESDQEDEPSAYRQVNNVQDSVEDALALAAMFDDRYADSGGDLASMEHDRLQLPTLGGSGAKRRRQPKITDAFGNPKRTKISAGITKDSRFAKPTSGPPARRKHAGPRRPHGTPPPALSVMDVELPPIVPEFLKLARRAARRDVNQARQSPRRKQIHLHTARDTEDATAALRQWRQGLLKPKVKPTTSQRQGDRPPLADTTDNWQQPLRLSSLDKHANNDVDTDLVPTISNQRSQERKTVAPALQMLQRASTLVSKSSRPKKVAQAFKGPEKVVQRGPLSLRAAQLEGDERKFGSSHRKMAFQKGLQRVEQQSGIHQAPKQPFLNPQLARFLADDDAVLPPLPTAKDIGKSQSESPMEASAIKNVPIPRKRLVRKPQAKRLDVDAREYRQPSEPMFDPVAAVPVLVSTESVSIEQYGNVLKGLGPFGTRYPTTFDVTPLKSDTYFHSDTFIGSEDLRRALSIGRHDTRDLDESAGYCTVSQGSTTIRCGPWNNETYSRIYELMTTILLPLGDSGDQENGETPLVDVLVSLSTVLRALASYFTRHLSFLDPIDRNDFTIKMQHLLQMVFDRVSTAQLVRREVPCLPEQARSTNRVLSHLLVVSTQVQQIAQHLVNANRDKAKLLVTIEDISRLTVNGITKGTEELYDFHEKNKLHKERENGIQGHDALVESVVICMHALELLNIPTLGFWDLVSQELSSPLSSANHVRVFENVWATVFSLLPFTEFDLSGIPDRTRTWSFDKDNWNCLCDLLKRICGFYAGTCGQNGSSINDYIRVNLTRCYVLINDWHWKRPDQILNVIFDFFGKHGLKPLRRETATGSVNFLQDFAAASGLTLVPNEASFHIALKCLVTGLQGMNNAYPEKKIRSFVFRRIPNHGRTYPKDQPLEEESLAALRNNHYLLSALYCAAPPSCRPKLDRIRGLVSHETSHREACRVSVRAWANLTTFQLSADEPYGSAKPFALWYRDIMHETLKQYRLAKTEAEDYLKSGVLDGTTEVSAVMVRQTMERNQEQVIATLRDSIAGMKKAIEHAKDQTSLATFLVDSDIVHLLELPHLEDHRLLSVIRDTLAVLRQYTSTQRAQIKQQESQPRSEESQDYGDFPDLDDLDDAETLQPVQTEAIPRPSRLDFIQGPLWHLMSNAFGAECPPDDNLLMDCVDTWVLIAGDQVLAGGKQWSHYMDSFSQVSWQQLRHTEQTRKFGPYFMSAVIPCDLAAYEEHRHEFLTALLLCLADRESMLRFQHRLLDAIVRTDEDHPLLRNLPFFRVEHGGLDITADTLRSRRLALISSLLSNMREDVYATSVQEPARTFEVKRMYAAMLKDFMARLKSNYQQLQQATTGTGAYVEFVQKIVQFLKQYAGDICPVLPFFTDSVAFPLPSTDPTYVVGRLCGYAPKVKDSGTAKQLSVFIQTVAQQAAADNQQVYLVNQLTTALCTDEAPVTGRVALRTVLLQAIFPAYIEGAFSSRAGHLIARPILQCLPAVLDEMVYDLRVNQHDSLSSTVHSIVSVAHALIRSTEQLKGDSLLLQQPSTLTGLAHMFEVATSISRLLDYIVDRTMTTGRGKPALITYLEEFSTYITQMIQGTVPHGVPSYRGDADAAPSNAQYADILAFCKRGLQSSLETNWSDDQRSVCFGQGRAKKEVVYDIGSAETERMTLMGTLRRFHDTKKLIPTSPTSPRHTSLLKFSDGLHDYGTEGDAVKWRPHAAAYFKKGKFASDKGISNTEKIRETAKGGSEAKLAKKTDKDPGSWDKMLKSYKRTRGAGGKNPIGGTKYNITKMSRKERASHAFDKKDPLADVSEKDLKEGDLDFA